MPLIRSHDAGHLATSDKSQVDTLCISWGGKAPVSRAYKKQGGCDKCQGKCYHLQCIDVPVMHSFIFHDNKTLVGESFIFQSYKLLTEAIASLDIQQMVGPSAIPHAPPGAPPLTPPSDPLSHNPPSPPHTTPTLPHIPPHPPPTHASIIPSLHPPTPPPPPTPRVLFTIISTAITVGITGGVFLSLMFCRELSAIPWQSGRSRLAAGLPKTCLASSASKRTVTGSPTT